MYCEGGRREPVGRDEVLDCASCEAWFPWAKKPIGAPPAIIVLSSRDGEADRVAVEIAHPVEVGEGQPFLAITQQFNRGTDEGFYGLGQHQNRQMNYNGEDVELAQHNMDVAVPFLLSEQVPSIATFQIGVIMYAGKFIKERPKVARDFI